VLDVAGFSIRSDNLGVTGTVRARHLDRNRVYASLLAKFPSKPPGTRTPDIVPI